MKKLFQYVNDNVFFWLTIFLLAFIPLYPKLPILDIKHTWVYIRIEDFVVLFVLFVWLGRFIRGKTTLVTPVSVLILLFWVIGAISTIHGIFFIFPSLTDAYPNVAFLSFIRRLEYMSVFFIAYVSIKDKRQVWSVISVLTVVVLAVVFYGIGQKYLGFPAFLTMNEEFAKGVPIRLSPLSRVASTFSGHYDLAAYLVLVLPIIVSIMFSIHNSLIRVVFLFVVILGIFVMMMTVSRISMFALLLTLAGVVYIQQKKILILSIPILAVGAFLLISFSPTIVDRFISTVKEVDVLVDAKTGNTIGHIKIVPKTHMKEKQVKQQQAQSIADVNRVASPSATIVIPYELLEDPLVLFAEPNAPTGENLPQGTGYINLTLSPVKRRIGSFYFEPVLKKATTSAEVFIVNGDYLLKKVLAYDLSFTTRFQGEWPMAMDAFKRNILFGSGYGSVGLAVDSSYIRMLGETGVLGFGAFMSVFLVAGIYIKKVIRFIQNPLARSYIIGFSAGVFGLGVNALFIDAFEASKVAFTLWLLLGIALGIVRLYERNTPDLKGSFKAILTSGLAVSVLLGVLSLALYGSMIRNNFVADDFTWLRWAAECKNTVVSTDMCNLNLSTIGRYFTYADGFFYRPGAKLYFLVMYSLFWLNQSVYHIVSLLLHFGVSVLVFFLSRKVFKSFMLSVFTSIVFLFLVGPAEPVFWISATGFLFTSFFSLLSLLFYINWQERRKTIYFILTVVWFIVAVSFHELGIVTPFFYLLYAVSRFGLRHLRERSALVYHSLLFIPLPFYLLIRFMASSHWLSGDYNYNIVKLPFNLVGNGLGYVLLTLFGPFTIPVIQFIRETSKSNIAISILLILGIGAGIIWGLKKYKNLFGKEDKHIVLFGLGFFLISLMPFIGLGNITSRYGYLASVGAALMWVFTLKKCYLFLLKNGRVTAMLGMLVITGTFSLFQFIQHEKVRSDWHEAGEVSRRFIVSIVYEYADYWANEPMEFHFVNVPIRYGEAWVYPVGIPDALWFLFRNPGYRVFRWPSVTQALSAVNYTSKNQKVFEFQPDGVLKERKKTQ